ncbi:unnamed protein product, partial [Nesidiocoris tenuis]
MFERLHDGQYLEGTFGNLKLFCRIASSHLCPVMAWGNYDEWQFALERLKNFPTNRSKAERTFLMKTVAGCPHDPKKYET